MSGCINAPVPKGGRYPRVRVAGRKVQRSRVVYCEHSGVTLADINGLVVRHTCDNTACINPVHLVLGTQKDNAADREQRGRGVVPDNRGERNAHAKLTAAIADSIRAEYVFRSPTHGRNALAKRYGVSGAVVSKILKGQAWRKESG